jgi:carboxyl-terminal processing protease
MSKWPQKKKLGMISGPFLLLLVAAGLAWASGDDLYTLIRLFDRVAVTVSDKYVDQLDSEKLIYAGIEGMMAKLDPYSRYLADEDYFYLMQETQGEYGGVGIDLDKSGDSVWVNSVIKNTPAAEANLKIGDRLLSIDSVDVIGKSIPDCRKLIRGDLGSKVSLTVWRPLLSRQFNLELTREEIHIEPVPYWFIDRYDNGYIKLARFSEGTIYELKSIISILKDKNVNGLILDLRDNPGGLLYESVEVAALFLHKDDKIVETKSRNGVSMQTYDARVDGIYCTGPLAVLINGQTASAAEIVAGAIQDNDRGLIIGSTSYGKGLVQQILQFSDRSALKLTTAKYYTPSDRCIQKDRKDVDIIEAAKSDNSLLFFTKSGRPVFGGGGIIPDIYVEPDAEPPLIEEVIALGYVDDYVGAYGSKHKIDDNFTMSDPVIDGFIGFVKGKGYVYYDDRYRKFHEFAGQVDSLSQSSHLKQPLAEMENVLKGIADELQAQRTRLGEVLYDDIVETYLGDKAAGAMSRQYNDPELVKAGEVLKSPELYSDLLVGF